MFLYSFKFKKSLRKFPKKLIDKILEKLRVLEADEFCIILNNHKLHGEYSLYRSINITGDIRLIYRKEKDNFFLIDIGTHNDLYE
ncbi:MAG: type II toxin-antitoxin system mRNA interferase toxin, RelE/StbE family [Candidatus Taylorbacteria bacterium]|nr:type II toxin-antitoxin system mRNA interferase toxin, RelE/StbE family [Candidatus Taylorbacteria bacterium]